MFVACFLILGVFVTGAGDASAAPELDCTTDRLVYGLGQPVRIECTNHGDDFVVTGISFLVTTADGGLVYNPAVPAIAVAVPPGESVEHTWDQTFVNSPFGDDGEQVPPGAYVASVRNGRPARFGIGYGPGDGDPLVAATASMVVWLDLMPVVPALDGTVRALIRAEFTNRSELPVRIEIESVTVRRTEDGDTLFVLLVKPPTGWDGVLKPGESSAGEWTKAGLLDVGTLECDVEVSGVLRVGCDGSALRVATEPTILSCVY